MSTGAFRVSNGKIVFLAVVNAEGVYKKIERDVVDIEKACICKYEISSRLKLTRGHRLCLTHMKHNSIVEGGFPGATEKKQGLASQAPIHTEDGHVDRWIKGELMSRSISAACFVLRSAK